MLGAAGVFYLAYVAGLVILVSLPALNDGDVVLKDAKKIEADLQQAADTDEAPELVQALVDRHIGGPFPIES